MVQWKDFVDPTAPTGRYLPWKEAARRTSLSLTTAWRLQRRGEFPRSHPISAGRVGHLERDVEAWLASRAGEESAPQTGIRKASSDLTPKTETSRASRTGAADNRGRAASPPGKHPTEPPVVAERSHQLRFEF